MPTSAQALCRLEAMTRVESIRVPSQSKMTRSYLRSSAFICGHRLDARAEFLEVGGQRRNQLDLLRADRMRERKFGRMEEHSFQTFLAQSPVELEVAVLVVAQHRVPEVREVHADL